MASTSGAESVQHSPEKEPLDANQTSLTAPKGAASGADGVSEAGRRAGELSGQASPAPSSPASGLSTTKAGSQTSSASGQTNPPPLSMPHPKKFSHVNINKKFLEKTSASTPSHTHAASPVTKTASTNQKPVLQTSTSHPRLVTAKLTATPQPSTTTGPGWSRPSSAVPSTAPTPLPAASTKASPAPAGAAPLPPPGGKVIQPQPRPSQDAVPQRRETSTKPAWGIAKGGIVPSSKSDNVPSDFPTAAEVAQGRVTKSGDKKGPEAATAHKQAELQAEEDTFRGVHLDPNAHHWDEMEEDDDNFLGGVIEFGDGRQYNVQSTDASQLSLSQESKQGLEPSGHSGLTDQPVSKEERFAEDFDRSWPRSRPPHVAPGQHRDQRPEAPPISPSSSHSPQESSRVLFNARSNRLEPYSHQRHDAPGPTLNRRGSRSDHTTSPIEPRRDVPPHTQLAGVQLLQKGPPGDGPPFSRAPGDRPPFSPHDGSRFRERQPFQRDQPVWHGSGHHGPDRHGGPHGPPYPPREAAFEDRARRLSGHELSPVVSSGDQRRQLPPHLSATGPRQPPPIRNEGQTYPPPPVAPVREPPAPSASSQAGASPATPEQALPAAAMPIVDMEEVRKAAMHSAAERARLRRQQEEEEREKERERARRKAAELEEKMKAMEQEKAREREKAESEKKRTEAEAVGLIEEAVSSVSPAENKVGAAEGASQRHPDARSSLARNISSRGSARPFSTRRTSFTPSTLPTDASVQPSPASEADTWRRKNPPAAPTSSVQAESQKPSAPPVLPPPVLAHADLDVKAGEEVEVFDFSDHGKLAGAETQPKPAPPPAGRPNRAVASDFFGDSSVAPQRAPPPPHPNPEEETWRRAPTSKPAVPPSPQDARHGSHMGQPPPQYHHGPASNGLQPTIIPQPPVPEDHSRRISSHHQNGIPRLVGSSYREAPMSTLNDTLSRIKGALAGMHHETETPAEPPVEPPKPQKWLPPALRPRTAQPDFTPPQEVFDVTSAEPPKSPKPAWNVFTVKFPRVSPAVSTPPQTELVWPRGQRQFRLDVYSFNPPIETLNHREATINDVIFTRPRMVQGQPKYFVRIPRRRITRRNHVAEPSGGPVVNLPTTPVRTRGVNPPKESVSSTASSWRKAPAPAATTTAPAAWRPERDESKEATGLDTVSRSPPPELPSTRSTEPSLPKPSEPVATIPAASSSAVKTKPEPKLPVGSDVAFYRNARVEMATESQPPVQFIVSSELEGEHRESRGTSEVQLSHPADVNAGAASASLPGQRQPEQQAPTYRASTNGTTTPPPQSQTTLPTWSRSPKAFSLKESPARAPDPEHLKAVWSQTSDKAQIQPVNSLKGIADDLTSVPFSLQDVKSDDGETPPPSGSGPWSRMTSHEVTRAFQQVPSPSSQRSASIAPSSSSATTNGSASRHPEFAFSPPPVGHPQLRPTYPAYSPMVSHSPSPTVMYPHPSPVPRHMVVNGSAPPGYGQAVWMPAMAGGAPPSAGMMRSPYPPPQLVPYPSPGGPVAMYPPPMPMQTPTQQNGVPGRPPSMAMMSPVMQPAMSPMYAGSPVLVQTAPVMPPGQGYPMPPNQANRPMRPYEQSPPNGAHMHPSPMRQPPQNGYNPIPSNYARPHW